MSQELDYDTYIFLGAFFVRKTVKNNPISLNQKLYPKQFVVGNK